MPEPTPFADDAALKRISRGNPDALAAWFHEHQGELYAFIYFRVGSDPDLAADVTQAAFTQALERLDQYDHARGEMITWLKYLSRNLIRSALASRRRGPQLQVVWDRIDQQVREAHAQIDSQPLPDEVLQQAETHELVEMALVNLPPNYRELLEAKYVDGQSLEAIASSRGATIDAVKSMLRRARAAFRDCFVAMANVEMSDA